VPMTHVLLRCSILEGLRSPPFSSDPLFFVDRKREILPWPGPTNRLDPAPQPPPSHPLSCNPISRSFCLFPFFLMWVEAPLIFSVFGRRQTTILSRVAIAFSSCSLFACLTVLRFAPPRDLSPPPPVFTRSTIETPS